MTNIIIYTLMLVTVLSCRGLKGGECTTVCSSTGALTADPKDCTKYYSCLEAGPDAQTIQLECPSSAPYFNGTTCHEDESSCCSRQPELCGVTGNKTTAPILCLGGASFDFYGLDGGSQTLTFCNANDKLPWLDAVEACSKYNANGQLASIDYPMAVIEYLKIYNPGNSAFFWTGAATTPQSTIWKWRNGERLQDNFPWTTLTNDATKNCQLVSDLSGYQEYTCSSSYQYICEVVGQTPNPTSSPGGCTALQDFQCPSYGRFARCPYCDPIYFFCEKAGASPSLESCDHGDLFDPSPDYPHCVPSDEC